MWSNYVSMSHSSNKLTVGMKSWKCHLKRLHELFTRFALISKHYWRVNAREGSTWTLARALPQYVIMRPGWCCWDLLDHGMVWMELSVGEATEIPTAVFFEGCDNENGHVTLIVHVCISRSNRSDNILQFLTSTLSDCFKSHKVNVFPFLSMLVIFFNSYVSLKCLLFSWLKEPGLENFKIKSLLHPVN